MNPVNATALYVSASRSVLQCDPRDPRELAELCKVLPFFRQSLSCLVCGKSPAGSFYANPTAVLHYICNKTRLFSSIELVCLWGRAVIFMLRSGTEGNIGIFNVGWIYAISCSHNIR
ncbi:hypothetical protein XENORESO_007520 [Xenotaenia resolanae]|uniref:Uncharacterized protein n=1 Tax=Xenotaenia resolanae TaxID=208358 RepID=A0ABV0W263_9TELE